MIVDNPIVHHTVALGKSLYTHGANIVTVAPGTKRPIASWKQFTVTRQKEQDIAVFLSALEHGRADRLAIVHYGGWVAIDLDARDHASNAADAPAAPDETLHAVLNALNLPPDYPWAGRSGGGRGFHVWLRCPDAPAKGGGGVAKLLPRADLPGSETIAGIEVRFGHCMTCLPHRPYRLDVQALDGPAGDIPLPAEMPFETLAARIEAFATPQQDHPRAARQPDRPDQAHKQSDAWFEEAKRRLDLAYDAERLAQVLARHLGGDVQEEHGSYRVTGHGGLIVTDRDGVTEWYNHSTRKGGGWAKALAMAFYGTAVPRGADYIAFLERAAQEVNVSLPPRPTSPAPARATDAGETLRGDVTGWAYTPITVKAPPSFPLSVFPPDAQRYAREVAASCEAAQEIVAQTMLSVIGVCLQRRVTVQARGGDWVEDTNVWTGIIAESGERKTSVFKIVLAPLTDYEQNKQPEYARRHREARAELEKKRRQLRRLEEDIRKGKAGGSAEEDWKALHIDVMAAEENIPPPKLSLFSSDITMEALVQQLRDYDGRYAILASEPRMFEALRQYSRTAAIPMTTLIEAYDNGEIKVTRARKDSVRADIGQPRVTLAIAFQPQTFVDLFRSNKNLRSGFLARFLWSLAPSLAGTRRFNAQPMNDEGKAWWRNLVIGLLDANLAGLRLTLCGHAAEMVRELNCDYDERSTSGGDLYRIKDWAARAGAHALRIACALHAMKHGKGILERPEIDAETMKAAITLVRDYFTHQARAVYDMFDSMPEAVDIGKVQAIEARLRTWDGDAFTARELYCKLRNSFHEMREFNRHLELFEMHKYIERVVSPPRRGRPSAAYRINPAIRTDAVPASPYATCQEPPDVAQEAPEAAPATLSEAVQDAPEAAPEPGGDGFFREAINAILGEDRRWGDAVDAYAHAAGLRRLEALDRIEQHIFAHAKRGIFDRCDLDGVFLATIPDGTRWFSVVDGAIASGAWTWHDGDRHGRISWTETIEYTRTLTSEADEFRDHSLEQASLADLLLIHREWRRRTGGASLP
jgi:hypothetical protein